MDKSIRVVDLLAYLSTQIKDCESVIENHPEIGTVKDNGRLGMLIAYKNMYNEVKNFEWKASKKFIEKYESGLFNK